MNAMMPMLAKVYEPRKTPLAFPAGVQRKYDGFRLCWDGYQARSRSGMILSVPVHILAELQRIAPGVALDGELYRHGLTLGQVASLVTNRSRATDTTLRYVVFDCPGEEPFAARYARLQVMAEAWDADAMALAPLDVAQDAVELARFRTAYLRGGYEGAMIRDLSAAYEPGRSAALLKWKGSGR